MKEIPIYRISPFKAVRLMRRNFKAFREMVLNKHNDIGRIKFLMINLIFINNPSYVKHILYDNSKNYPKTSHLALQQPMWKNSLPFTNDYEHWKKDKTSMMPAFHKNHFESYVEVFTENCQKMLSEWEIYAQKDQPMDIYEMMTHLTLKNILQTLFGDSKLDIAEFNRLLVSVLLDFSAQTRSLGLKWKLPTKARFRYQKNMARVEELVLSLINARKSEQTQGNNVLDMLIAAYKDHPNQEQVVEYLKSEVFALLAAGHETASATLEWIWITLSENPTVTQKLRQEIKEVLNGRTPTFEDLANMPYTRGVVLETMRMHPPIDALSRRTVAEDEIDGYRIPANSITIMSVSSVHRREEFWENPHGFNPERFFSIDLKNKYLYAYLPFGAGPRICIGKEFSIVEISLIVAMVIQKFDLYLLPNFKLKSTTDTLVIRPQYDLLMKVKSV